MKSIIYENSPGRRPWPGRRLGAAFALYLCLCLTPALAAPPADARLQDLPSYIERARAELRNVGAAVVVVKDGRVAFSGGFGLKQHDRPEPVGADTLFQIGSTTKAFTAAALGILVDEGKLDWDDPVVKYLPDFRLSDPWLTRQLTVRDTLTHRTGIVAENYHILAVIDAQAAVDQLRYAPAVDRFRDSYHYSNPMYAVAGKLIEAVSGQSWHAFMRERLLQPLQMARSGTTAYDFWDRKYVTATFRGLPAVDRWQHADARDPDVAMPHLRDADGTLRTLPWQSYDNAAAAGTLVSSVNDLAHWLMMHLDQGRFAGRQILQPGTLRELHALQNPRHDAAFPFGDDMEGYAMGWRRARHHGRAFLWHGGGIQGFPAYVAMMPEAGIGIAVLANQYQQGAGSGYALHESIALHAVDLLLDQPPRDWVGEYAARARQTLDETRTREAELQAGRLKRTRPSLPLERYAGVYENRTLHSGPVTVSLENGRLSLRFPGAGAFTGDLEHWHRDVFRLHSRIAMDLGQFPSFAIDPAGKVVSMSLFGSTYDRILREESK